jgi:hypothetical protein
MPQAPAFYATPPASTTYRGIGAVLRKLPVAVVILAVFGILATVASPTARAWSRHRRRPRWPRLAEIPAFPTPARSSAATTSRSKNRCRPSEPLRRQPPEAPPWRIS